MAKRDVLYFSPDPIEEALSNLEEFTVDSAAIRSSIIKYAKAVSSLVGAATVIDNGIFESWHVTDDNSIMENAFTKGRDLAEGRTIGSHICPGFSVTTHIGRHVTHSKKRWAFLSQLKQEDIEKLSEAIRTELIRQVTTKYITQSEYNHAVDALFVWINHGNTYGPTMVSAQPYNIDVPLIAKTLQIAEIQDPYVALVNFEGRYLDMTDREPQEEAFYLASLVLEQPLEKLAIEDVCSVLRKAGWDGVFNRGTMGFYPELVLWNGDKILRFGSWRRNEKPSLSGAYKTRPQRVKLEFVYDCPAKGRVQFTIWPRKGEMQEDTGHRGLRELVRLDEPQIPFCRKIYAKYID